MQFQKVLSEGKKKKAAAKRKMFVSCLPENTRAKSDVFAAENNLPNFEYVLHPRTTGFTFIVDKLRKGSSIFTWTV